MWVMHMFTMIETCNYALQVNNDIIIYLTISFIKHDEERLTNNGITNSQ